MKHRSLARQAGFTLVEIAIVLVIIGLLLGGVLKGQELIKSAKVKAYKSNADAITVAFNGYLERFRALPGDDIAALTRFPVANFPNIVNGNGNAFVDSAWNSVTLTDESNQAFMHLIAGGFIKGDANALVAQELKPKGPNGETMGVQMNAQGLPGVSVCYGNMSGEMAELYDIAFDDGRPGGGSIRVNNTPAQVNYAAIGATYKTQYFTSCTAL